MILERLAGGLIVSVQAEPNSFLNAPETIALLARVAEHNGAAGIRAEGLARIGAVRRAIGLPVIGLIKRAYVGFEPYITVTEREVAEVVAAGADIVAFDATVRMRPAGSSVASLIAAIHTGGALAMADCADADDAFAAAQAGVDIVGTTLCGYTPATHGTPLPAIDLVGAIRAFGLFTICEGGVSTPFDVQRALEGGADAVVVGTAITNIDALVRRFTAAVKLPT